MTVATAVETLAHMITAFWSVIVSAPPFWPGGSLPRASRSRCLPENRHQHRVLAVRMRDHEEVVVVAAPLDDLHLREELPADHAQVLEAERPADRRRGTAAMARAGRHRLAVLVHPAGRGHDRPDRASA